VARKPLPTVVPTDRITPPDRGRRYRRFLLGALIAAALAVAMSGCALIKSNSSAQLNTVGAVQITTVICAGDTNSNNTGYNPADASCQGSTKGGNYPGDAVNGTFQISLAYRVPNTAGAPSSFTSSNTSNPPTTPCGSGVTFNQNSGLASAIQALSPAGSGKKWVAYYSTTQSYNTANCQYLTVSPQFTLGQVFNVIPFTGPFNYRPIVGFRQVNDAQAGNTSSRAATCGSSITSGYSDGVDFDNSGSVDMIGICADDPTAATISGADLTQATRDLGVIPSGTGSAHAGGSGTSAWTLSYKGAALPSGNFQLSASTNIPGGTATPANATYTPTADTDTPMNVNVTAPAGTTPGTYTVQLVATLSTDNTQTRGIVTANFTVGNAFEFDTAPALPSLGSIALNARAQTTTAQMNNFSVNDTTASPAGWNVTVAGDSSAGKSAVFKQYCNNGGSVCGSDAANSYVSAGRTLLANSLSLNSTGASWTGGTGSAPTFPCGGGSCPIDSATPTKIASAANGSAGTGLWSTTGFTSSSTSLATPSTLRVLPANEIYRLDVVWSLNSGP
jgi:hypothetical protein